MWLNHGRPGSPITYTWLPSALDNGLWEEQRAPENHKFVRNCSRWPPPGGTDPSSWSPGFPHFRSATTRPPPTPAADKGASGLAHGRTHPAHHPKPENLATFLLAKVPPAALRKRSQKEKIKPEKV